MVELPDELRNKLWAMVRYVCIGETVELPDILLVQVSSTHSRAGCVGWNEVSPLAVKIHSHQNGVIAMRLQELYNEVNRGHITAFHEHRQRVQLISGEAALGLGPKAEVAGADVGAYVL